MTRRSRTQFTSSVTFVLGAALIAAACSDRVVAPTGSYLEATGTIASHRSGDDDDKDNNGHAKNKGLIDARVLLDETTGVVTVIVTTGKFDTGTGEIPPVEGSLIQKITVELPGRRDCRSEYKFNKPPANNGKLTVTLPAGSCARAGVTAEITVHAKGLKKGNGTTVVVVRVPVASGEFSGAPFDLVVIPMMQAAPNPADNTPVDFVQVDVTQEYDVTVSNAASGFAAPTACQVLVDGADVTLSTQFWVDGAGTRLTLGFGESITIPSGAARICRFALTFSTPGEHAVTVNVSAPGMTESNLLNNTTVTVVTATALPPLVGFEWVLRQEDAVEITESNINGDPATIASEGLVIQTGQLHMYWEETLGTQAGQMDTWSFTVRSRSNNAMFDERVAQNVSMPRITQAELAIATDGIACRTLQADAPSATRPSYLISSVTVCALITDVPDRARMRLTYHVRSDRFLLTAPFVGSEALLWGPTFSFFAQIEHTGETGTGSFGGQEDTRSLVAPQIRYPTVPTPGRFIRLVKN